MRPRDRGTPSTGAARRWAAGALAASLCLTFAGCDNLKVKKPDSDSTPPVLVWNVYDHDSGQQADHPGSPTLSAQRGDSFRIILKANDPQGVHKIQMNPTLGGGEMTWQCTSGDLGQQKNATFGPLTQTLAPDSNGMVLTSIFLIFELDLAMACQSGWSFSSGQARLTGQANNYFGGVTTEVLRFNVSP